MVIDQACGQDGIDDDDDDSLRIDQVLVLRVYGQSHSII